MSGRSSDSDRRQARLQAELQALQQGFDTLLLATVNHQGQADASYAPFVQDERHFYVYVSELAAHTGNLLGRGEASVMFIENEDACANLFARKRLTYRCRAEELEPGEQFERILDLFQARFGDFIGMLRPLGDFHLVRLTPQSGVFVAGFARAFAVDGDRQGGLRLIEGSGGPPPAGSEG